MELNATEYNYSLKHRMNRPTLRQTQWRTVLWLYHQILKKNQQDHLWWEMMDYTPIVQRGMDLKTLILSFIYNELSPTNRLMQIKLIGFCKLIKTM